MSATIPWSLPKDTRHKGGLVNFKRMWNPHYERKGLPSFSLESFVFLSTVKSPYFFKGAKCSFALRKNMYCYVLLLCQGVSSQLSTPKNFQILRNLDQFLMHTWMFIIVAMNSQLPSNCCIQSENTCKSISVVFKILKTISYASFRYIYIYFFLY